MATRRAVFTGLGLLTPIGTTAEAFWRSLCAGTSGVSRIAAIDPAALPCKIGGEIAGFDAKKLIPASRKETRRALNKMGRTIQLGVCAAEQAMAGGGPKAGEVDPERFGIEFACVMVATEPEDLVRAAQLSCADEPGRVDLPRWGREGLGSVPPLWMLKYLPNMPACHVSVGFDARGPNNTITSTDAAGLLALGEAYRLLGRNAADFFLVGGCDSKANPVSQSRFATFAPLTRTHDDDPARGVRPFDAARDGTALGEAGCVFGLEDLGHARRRGATILGELCGYASGFDRGLKGAVLAGVIRAAMKEAGVGPADIDHVNAAAGGWTTLDAWEARGIREAVGDVPVAAYKGFFGNTAAASGLVELAASVLALRHGELPGTVNCDPVGADCPVNVHVGPPRAVTKPYAVKVSFTDLGQCAAAVVKRWEG